MGVHFFDDRGWGDLIDGTLFHFPIPGIVLLELGLPNYTFGGNQPQMSRAGPAPSLPSEVLRAYWTKFRTRMEEREAKAESNPGVMR